MTTALHVACERCHGTGQRPGAGLLPRWECRPDSGRCVPCRGSGLVPWRWQPGPLRAVPVLGAVRS